MKKKKYRVWVHVDTGYYCKVEAESQDEAEQEAQTNCPLSPTEWRNQLEKNAQTGEATATEI